MNTGVKNWVRFEFPSISENISFARACAAAFASQLDCTLEQIENQTGGLGSGVQQHHTRLRQDPKGSGTGNQTGEEKTVEIIVEDRGCGIADVEQAMQPLLIGVGKDGPGVRFMRSFMDDLEVTSEVGVGTRVRMVKSLLPGKEELGE